MKEIVNWGVLGCAGIGKKVTIPAILQARNARLYALASRTSEKLKDFCDLFHPVKGYLDYDELLEDPDVDAVYLPLPNALHCDWVVKACRMGKPVLCEKPLAMSTEEVEKIIRVSKETGVPVMEAFAYLHGPMMAKIREIVDSGRLGPIRYMESNFAWLLEDLANVRLNKEIGGGVCLDMMCYPFSFFLSILGKMPEEIKAFTTYGEASGVDEDVLAILRFPGGVKASSSCSFRYHKNTRNLIACRKGTIDFPSFFDYGGVKTITVKTKEGTETYEIDTADRYALQVEQMGNVVLRNEAPLVSLDLSLNIAKVIDWVLTENV